MKNLVYTLFLFYPLVANACYEASITTPQPFMGNNGEIFKLSDDSIWEVQYEYEYLYEYYPDIIACPKKKFIIINGQKLNAIPIHGSQDSNSSKVIESKIDGESEGFEGDTIFKLTNGQIWQQID